MLTAHLPFLNSKTVVLASQSPRRLEILGRLALRVTVDASKFDETLDKAQFASAGGAAGELRDVVSPGLQDKSSRRGRNISSLTLFFTYIPPYTQTTRRRRR